jgi:hypothetical protein
MLLASIYNFGDENFEELTFVGSLLIYIILRMVIPKQFQKHFQVLLPHFLPNDFFLSL